MPGEITIGPSPNIVIHKIRGDLTYEDMTADELLGLNLGKPLYILLDVSELSLGLPENFLSGAKHSYFVNPNLMHMALFTRSGMLNMIGKMVAKVTRRQEYLSIHSSFQSALTHLQNLISQELGSSQDQET